MNQYLDQNLLELRDVRTQFRTEDGIGRAVDGVSLTLKKGETLGIVGESGSGKSMTALSILRLLGPTSGATTEGQVLFRDRDLLKLSEQEMNEVRGNEIAMIFQDPMTCLNPVFTVGDQISETIMRHQNLSRRDAFKRAVEMLRMVRIPDPEQRAREYAHQLSGGMRQRVMIAMALSCNPAVLIADEPTTALDVTIQAQVLDLIEDLQQEFNTAVILISHDLGVIAETADRVAVMYAGRKVEEAEVGQIFRGSLHPYTRGLLASTPRLQTGEASGTETERLNEIPGSVPSLFNLPQGCSFAARCSLATDQCRVTSPNLEEKRPDHLVACWNSHLLLEGAS